MTLSPFRYPGGKFYARKLILDVIPPFHRAYCEPFAGGGSIFFAKPKAAANQLNDKDANLVAVYRVIRDQPDELIAFVTSKPPTKETHKYLKQEFIPSSELEQAGRWFFLNRTSYSGIMHPSNCYFSYSERYYRSQDDWGRIVRDAAAKLAGVVITNEDFEAVIDSAPDESFLFVDPPYYRADQTRLYTHCFSEEDHQRLLGCLRRHAQRVQFLLTYDDCPEIREMYAWCDDVRPMEWAYRAHRSDDQKGGAEKGRRTTGKELFVSNY